MTAPTPPRRHPNVLLQTFVVGQLASELIRRELEPLGMTPNEYGVQSVIGAFGPLTPTDLAARLGMAAPTVSAWIKRLAERDQIASLSHPPALGQRPQRLEPIAVELELLLGPHLAATALDGQQQQRQ